MLNLQLVWLTDFIPSINDYRFGSNFPVFRLHPFKGEFIMKSQIESLEARLIGGGSIEEAEALSIMELSAPDLYDLFPSANRIARHFRGSDIELCSIVNAKSGRCRENCAFCAQSVHHKTDTPVYDLIAPEEITGAALEAESAKANRFGIVTSGIAISASEELDALCESVSTITGRGKVSPCASLGIISTEALKALRDVGLRGYHHNLETARSFFPEICTTHEYDDDVETVRRAKALGFMTCSGGIFGIGESPAQRVEMGLTLRELDVDSVPINFLVPVPGTRLENRTPLEPLECLKIIAVYRFLLPDKTIKICAGRDLNLGDMQSWIFYAGANGMMVGNYLTTAGRDPEMDLEMIRILGFHPVAERSGEPL